MDFFPPKWCRRWIDVESETPQKRMNQTMKRVGGDGAEQGRKCITQETSPSHLGNHKVRIISLVQWIGIWARIAVTFWSKSQLDKSKILWWPHWIRSHGDLTSSSNRCPWIFFFLLGVRVPIQQLLVRSRLSEHVAHSLHASCLLWVMIL